MFSPQRLNQTTAVLLIEASKANLGGPAKNAKKRNLILTPTFYLDLGRSRQVYVPVEISLTGLGQWVCDP